MPDTPVQPAGLFPGAVDHGGGRVTFALYAPGKQAVSLIGDFNQWDRGADPLQATPEGLWWIEKHFEPGSHTYQFAIDGGEIIICDPYARALAEDSEYDPPRALVEVDSQPFAWQHDDWARPDFSDLILYEIHVGDFMPEGSFDGVTSRLDYLKELGVNCIELMPIFEFKGDLGWGYDPAYFFTVEKSYGTPDELRELVDAAHSRGIGVVLDLVLAHTAHRHPFNKLYPYEQSPWYGVGCGETNQFGFPMLDYTKGPTQAFARDVQHYWLNEFHVDGFRYDYCWGIGCCDGMGMPHLINTVREVRPDVYLIGEYSPENPEDATACGLDGAWHVALGYGMKALMVEGGCGDFNWDDLARCANLLNPWEQGYVHASQMINYLESHDEMRVMHDLQGDGFDPQAAYARAGLGAVVLMTMPGEPMLYHGQEWGEATPRLTNERNTLHWELRDQGDGRMLLARYQMLARLRQAHSALRGETFSLDALYPEQKSFVYHRWNDAGDEVVVAVNFSPDAQTVRIPFPQAGRWCDVLSDQEVEAQGEYDVEMPASSGAVYVKREG
jgi:1,4-alpha-glucan branching enzyme